MQDCRISIANAMKIYQPCTKPLIYVLAVRLWFSVVANHFLMAVFTVSSHRMSRNVSIYPQYGLHPSFHHRRRRLFGLATPERWAHLMAAFTWRDQRAAVGDQSAAGCQTRKGSWHGPLPYRRSQCLMNGMRQGRKRKIYQAFDFIALNLGMVDFI